MILDIVTLNDKRLRIPSTDITEINEELIDLINDMYETLSSVNGVGLSAVQVGELKRLFITDVPGKGGRLVVINPVIREISEKTKIYEEGCLSIPGISGNVERPESVVLEYTDLKGKSKTIKANGLLATCIQHEYDHLNGMLFIDRLDPELKLIKINEYRKIKTV